MSKKRIVFVSAMLLLYLAVPAGMASSETTVSYYIATDDVFQALTDVDASVTLDCSAVFNSSDGTILPNSSTKYSITAKPGSGTLTVNYKIDRPLLKKSGSPSVPINPTWLLGDSPPITVYDDGTVKITVIIHGRLNGQVIAVGNGSATPSSVAWSTWKTMDITVSANVNAQNGQTIQIQTATKYVVYFTVKVELIGIASFTQDSPTKEASGSPAVQSVILVVEQNQPPAAVILSNPSDIAQNSMRLTWTQNNEADFARYEIYKSTSSGNLGTKIYIITDGTTTSYVVTGLAADTTYYFTVRVMDTGGLYTDSNQVSGETTPADTTPPSVSVTFTPSSPDTTQTVTFTVAANDNIGGSGIKNITLYINANPARTWTTAGTHSYIGGPYSQGIHTYYAEAFDNANNKGREPATGNREFTVSAQPAPQPVSLWQILAIASVAVVAIAIIALIARRKKS